GVGAAVGGPVSAALFSAGGRSLLSRVRAQRGEKEIERAVGSEARIARAGGFSGREPARRERRSGAARKPGSGNRAARRRARAASPGTAGAGKGRAGAGARDAQAGRGAGAFQFAALRGAAGTGPAGQGARAGSRAERAQRAGRGGEGASPGGSGGGSRRAAEESRRA